MVWPWPVSSPSSNHSNDSDNTSKRAGASPTTRAGEQSTENPIPTSTTTTAAPFLETLYAPSTLVATALLTSTILLTRLLYRRYLRRIPTTLALPPAYLLPNTRRFTRSLFGHVTSVGDADNFRLYHTPLGRLAGFGLLRPIPTTPKLLKNQTLHVRLAGIDAPELAHFGKPEQPFARDALDWLTAYIRGRRVRCYVHRADQYGRVVATVYVRRGLMRRDVGLEMLRRGLATVYEAKFGVEFGGKGKEEKYRSAEARARREKRGMFAAETLETPREYKNRMKGEGVDEIG